MKRLIALLLILAFAAALPCFLSCDKPEEASLTEASEETRELVRTVLQKLNESYVDFWGWHYATPASSERIYDDACALVPEIRELDSRNDGALALLEEYESLLALAESNLGFQNPLSSSALPVDREKTDKELKRRAEPIEGLFARRFYKKLDESGRERFLKTLSSIYNDHTLPLESYEDKERCHAYFFLCGGEKLITDHEILIMNGEVYFRKGK